MDRLLFGSDWPHAEGLAEPRTFAQDLLRHGFEDDEIRTIMCDNGRLLARRRSPGDQTSGRREVTVASISSE